MQQSVASFSGEKKEKKRRKRTESGRLIESVGRGETRCTAGDAQHESEKRVGVES